MAWEKKENGIAFDIAIPEGMQAEFVYKSNEFELKSGNNTYYLVK